MHNRAAWIVVGLLGAGGCTDPKLEEELASCRQALGEQDERLSTLKEGASSSSEELEACDKGRRTAEGEAARCAARLRGLRGITEVVASAFPRERPTIVGYGRLEQLAGGYWGFRGLPGAKDGAPLLLAGADGYALGVGRVAEEPGLAFETIGARPTGCVVVADALVEPELDNELGALKPDEPLRRPLGGGAELSLAVEKTGGGGGCEDVEEGDDCIEDASTFALTVERRAAPEGPWEEVGELNAAGHDLSAGPVGDVTGDGLPEILLFESVYPDGGARRLISLAPHLEELGSCPVMP